MCLEIASATAVASSRHRKITVRAVLTSLVGGMEVVQEGITTRDRALSHESRAICPVRSRLEHAVPVLIDSVRLRVKGHEQDKFRDIR